MLDEYEVQQQLAELYQEREEKMIQLEELDEFISRLGAESDGDEREKCIEDRDDLLGQIDELDTEVASLEEQLDSLGN